jgi:hypothetical protein
MTKLLAGVAAVGLVSNAAFAQMYITMSPPPIVPPYFSDRGSTNVVVPPPGSVSVFA